MEGIADRVVDKLEAGLGGGSRMSDYLFKATDGNKATHGGDYTYRKGRWTRAEEVVPCMSGWHLAKGKQVLDWLAPTLWLAETHPDFEVVDADQKCRVS